MSPSLERVPLRLSRTQPPNPAITPGAYRGYNILSVVGRLKPGVTAEEARAELALVGAQLARAHPETNRHTELTAESLQDAVVGPIRPALLLLLGAVACVLLIACANIASLLLVRAIRRSREITIRMALGADRARLARQMFHRKPGPRAGRRWNWCRRQRVAARPVVARGAARHSAA